MKKLTKLFRMLIRSGFHSVYLTLKIRLRRLFTRKEHIVLSYTGHCINLPLIDSLTYQKYDYLDEVSDYVKQSLHESSDNNQTNNLLLFEEGATFWAVFFNKIFVGYWWSKSKKLIDPWYIPLNCNDIVFFAATIFPEWRGRSFSPIALNKIIKNEIPIGISVYLDVETWNESALKAWSKAGFTIVGTYPPLIK